MLKDLNMKYDMVIKKNFAKYVIDNKAKLVQRNNSSRSDQENTKSIYAPAFNCNIENVSKCLKDRVVIKTSNQETLVPFVKLNIKVMQNNGCVLFSILFEESLLKFLPANENNFQELYVSFASTAVDNFLFLQFPETNLQIRTLLVSREDDLPRIFQEKSFYAIPIPHNFIQSSFSISKIGPPSPNKVDESISSLKTGKSIVKVEPNKQKSIISFLSKQKNIRYQKESYTSYEITLEEKTFDLFFHESNLEQMDKLRNQNYQNCTKTDDGYSVVGPTGDNIALKEIIINFEDIPRTMLTCSSFLVDKSNLGFLKDNGFSIDPMPIVEKLKEPLTGNSALSCPFPNCNIKLAKTGNSGVISHFLTHQDFKRVVMGQIKRHQDRKSVGANTCPFDQCKFTSWNQTEMEVHYGSHHHVGHIVFLQFSKANKWSTDPFVASGVLNENILSLVQCSHCYEVMTRQRLAIHIQVLRAASQQQK